MRRSVSTSLPPSVSMAYVMWKVKIYVQLATRYSTSQGSMMRLRRVVVVTNVDVGD